MPADLASHARESGLCASTTAGRSARRSRSVLAACSGYLSGAIQGR